MFEILLSSACKSLETAVSLGTLHVIMNIEIRRAGGYGLIEPMLLSEVMALWTCGDITQR